jgi:hypothetical protein
MCVAQDVRHPSQTSQEEKPLFDYFRSVGIAFMPCCLLHDVIFCILGIQELRFIEQPQKWTSRLQYFDHGFLADFHEV